jgi:ATP adenylyltransferase
MKRLWAPWRMQFVSGGNKECIFCVMPRKDDKSALILYRGEKSFVIMNRFPYNNGHLMVAPFRHVKELGELAEEEMAEMMRLVSMSIEALKKSIRPAAFNVGANIGRSSGAGFEHLHMHVVPRWDGDTNFMPVLGETKVIPEYLEETYDKLVKAFPRSTGQRPFTPGSPSPFR